MKVKSINLIFFFEHWGFRWQNVEILELLSRKNIQSKKKWKEMCEKITIRICYMTVKHFCKIDFFLAHKMPKWESKFLLRLSSFS
jgi:hypothetical protein